eukprot:12262300-Heterocapsa_arctica.AAC.1
MDLESPEAIDSRFDHTMPSCPVILLIEELRRRGWFPQDAMVLHSGAGRTYCLQSIWARSDYLRVLLRWAEFSHLAPIRSDSSQSLWKCLLAGKQ